MRKREGVSSELEELGGRFEQWRKSQVGRRRLPEELWAAAVAMAGQQGVYQTSRVLRLDYANLKRRMEATSGTQSSSLAKSEEGHSRLKRRSKAAITPKRMRSGRSLKRASSVKKATGSTAFVELLAESIAADCLIDLDGAGGSRMRIRMRLTALEVMRLVRDWRDGEAQPESQA